MLKIFPLISPTIDSTNPPQTEPPVISSDRITMTEKELIFRVGENSKNIKINDIVGAFIDDCNSSNHRLEFVVNAYPISPKQPRRLLQQYRFFCPDLETRSRWIATINNRIIGISGSPTIAPPRRLKIFINPSSGIQKGGHLFQEARQVLENSYVKFSVTETTHPGDIYNQVQLMDLSPIDGLVVVGGDGTVYEVINGLMNRPDWETAIRTPIGVIPAGTSNGLCKTLLESAGESYDSINATIAIAKGKIKPVDLLKITQGDRQYFGVLSVSWGLIADVDIESDKLRFLGSLKTDTYALFKILTLRSYRGKISLIPVDPDDEISGAIADDWILLWAMNLPWAAYNLNAAPHSQISDGKMTVLLVRKGMPKLRLLKAFSACETGRHISIPGIESYQVRGFRLEPRDGERLAIDGEPVPSAPIQVEVIPSLARVFHP
ncbi:MAG: diacylglycerol kinase family protein [Limnospira sp.]